MSEFEINGNQYRTGRLQVMTKFHISRILAPVLLGFMKNSPDDLKGTAQATVQAIETESSVTITRANIATMFGAMENMASALAQLSRADSEFVLNECLAVAQTERADHRGIWAKVAMSEGRVMFQDIDLPEILRIVIATLQENLGGFFTVAPSTSTEKAVAPPTSISSASQTA